MYFVMFDDEASEGWHWPKSSRAFNYTHCLLEIAGNSLQKNALKSE
jgi:hypothetical protein